MSKPKLYQYTACPFCSKVRTMLEFKGVDYEAIEVHPLNKKELDFSPDYRKVPVYIDSQGQQVNDSTPIMQHIDQEFEGRTAFCSDTADKEREQTWLDWSQGLVKGLPTVIYDTVGNAIKSFDYITKVGQFSWFQKRMIKYSGAFIMTMVAGKIKKREGIDDPTQFVRTKAEELVTGLENQAFLGGAAPNGADLAIYGIVQSVAGLNAGDIFDENAEFKAWCQRMKEVLENNPKLQPAA